VPKRISKKPKDTNQIAAAVVALSTSEDAPLDTSLLSRAMAEMGRKGGKIAGKRSVETMSATTRERRAKAAAKARCKPQNKTCHESVHECII
jgi:hypothetical protein